MRILLVTQYFYPENFKSNDIAFELAKRGHHVDALGNHANSSQKHYLVIPHHGGNAGAVSYNIAKTMNVDGIVSVGKNSHRHPNPKVMSKVKSLLRHIDSTDISGDITKGI